MKIRAFGKINPVLNVGKTREDGYHEVCLLMQQVGMYDELEIEPVKTDSDAKVVFSCSADLGIPDEKNLAVKAARLMQQTYGMPSVSIHLEKRLPAAAGMAGGSTDAAAVLKGVRDLFRPEITDEELMQLGAQLGSDVPYCITGGTAVCRGRGELVEKVDPMPLCYLTVFKPDFGVSTPWAYQNFKENDPANPPADMDALLLALKQKDLRALTEAMGNQLYPPVKAAHPVLEEIIRLTEEAGAVKAMMTGSGPTVFGIFVSKELRDSGAERLQQALKEKQIGGQLYLTETVNL